MQRRQESTPWVLEARLEGGRRVWRTEVSKLPFLIGRNDSCDLRVPVPAISGRHAELVSSGTDADGLVVRDLGSKNGTFVNHERIEGEQTIGAGDLLHVANQEFVLLRQDGQEPRTATVGIDLQELDSARGLAQRQRAFETMLARGQVGNVYQPVVDLESGEHLGYEALGRGFLDGLPQGPGVLFEIAGGLGIERQLCQRMRAAVVSEAKALPEGAALFLNTHPSELDDLGTLVDSLMALRKALPGQAMVLELHEMAVADGKDLRPTVDRLRELGVDLAFDDFGKGRDRFLELAELAPNYLKFDRRLIAGLGDGAERREREIRRRMVESIISAVTDFGVRTIAEGIETQKELETCRALGFDLGQGYFWGRPAGANQWR
ncbi:MAG: EAL domain-containing protein [Acidobacteriota bacterium]